MKSCPQFVPQVEPKLSPSSAQVFPQIGHLRNTLTHCSRALLPTLAERSSSAIWASTNLGQHTHEQSSNLPLSLQQIVSQCDSAWGFGTTNNAKFPGIEIEIALIAFDITIRDLVCALALALLHIVSYPVIFYVIWQIFLAVQDSSIGDLVTHSLSQSDF